MGARIIDRKAYADGRGERIAACLHAVGGAVARLPGLEVVLVGNDPASEVCLRSKGKTTRKPGLESSEHLLPRAAPGHMPGPRKAPFAA